MDREYDDDYPTCAGTYVSLLFRNETASPSDVTAALGLEPTEVWAAPNGWCFCSEDLVESKDFRRHLDFILERVRGKEPQVARLLQGGWSGDISVYWASRTGHGGPIVWPDQATRLGDLGLEIWFDIYFLDDEGIDAPLAPGELTSSFRRATRHWRRFGIPPRRRPR